MPLLGSTHLRVIESWQAHPKVRQRQPDLFSPAGCQQIHLTESKGPRLRSHTIHCASDNDATLQKQVSLACSCTTARLSGSRQATRELASRRLLTVHYQLVARIVSRQSNCYQQPLSFLQCRCVHITDRPVTYKAAFDRP